MSECSCRKTFPVGLSEVQPFFAQGARKLLGIQGRNFGNFSALQNPGGLFKISERALLGKETPADEISKASLRR